VTSTANSGQRVPAEQLPATVTRAAARYRLGTVTGWQVITTGYEDANLAVTTSSGAVVIKIFPAWRGAVLPARTTALVEAAIRVGVRHPPLRHAGTGAALTLDPNTGCHLLVMDAIAGADFYTPPRAPTLAELTDLAEQAALIPRIGVAVDPVANLWALTHLPRLAELLRPHLDDEQQHLVTAAARAYAAVDHQALPHALIHNDLTKGNVLAAESGLWMIDFGCADRYPRIQELAVIAANLTHGTPRPLLDRAEEVADRYAAHVPLTTVERRALPTYATAAAAMELLGALYARHIDGDDRPETGYLIELGLAGLRS
jgi:Ser/Thr protein kinase RdoA (MazF antagonist)